MSLENRVKLTVIAIMGVVSVLSVGILLLIGHPL